MSKNSVRTEGGPEQVFDVLDDAYAYPRWVVVSEPLLSVRNALALQRLRHAADSAGERGSA